MRWKDGGESKLCRSYEWSYGSEAAVHREAVIGVRATAKRLAAELVNERVLRTESTSYIYSLLLSGASQWL